MSVRSKGSNQAHVACALALLLAAPLGVLVQAAETPTASPLATGVAYEWWGPTDASGWHFRLPVLVHPKLPDPVTKFGVAADFAGGLGRTPVRYEVDFSDAVRRTNAEGRPGWPMDEFGRLASFTLDPSSIRVVAYDRGSGRVDAGEGREGLVPHLFSTGLYENPEGRNPVYNASQNAVGTLQWIVPGPFTGERLYFVYFDTVQNDREHPKPEVDWTEAEKADLLSNDFLRPATELYGYLPASPQIAKARLYVWSIYPNTTLEVFRYRFAGFEPEEVPPCARRGVVGMCMSGGQLVEDQLNLPCGPNPSPNCNRFLWQATTANEPVAEPFFFKVVSSKPVHAYVGPQTTNDPEFQTSFWAPSLDGSLLGTRFRIPTTAGPCCAGAARPDGLFVVAGDEDANYAVGVDSLPGFPVPLKARQVAEITNYRGGQTVYVTSDAPVMVGSMHWHVHGMNQAVSQYGAPYGTTLFVGATKSTGMAVVAAETSATSAFSLENPGKSFPTDGPRAMQEGADEAWYLPLNAFAESAGDISGHLWTVRSSGMTTAYGGDRGLDLVGGLEGKEFHLLLRTEGNTIHPVEPKAFVMALYPGTRVDVERYDDARGRYASVLQKVVGPDAPLSTRPGSAEPVMHGNLSDPGFYRVRATKPILVYQYAEEDASDAVEGFPYQTFVGGSVRSPLLTVGTVEFYGPLVSWVEKLAQRTVKPGDQVVVTGRVLNLGRSHDGEAQPDSVSFVTRAQKDAPAWTTRLSTAFEANVPGGEAREVTVVVDVPKDAKTDEALDLEVVATSETNPAIRDTFLVQITVQTRYEIEVVFKSNNKNTLQSVIDPGVVREFPLRVKNIGSGPDGVTFTMLRANPFGFDADILFERTPGDATSRESFLDAQGLPRIGIDGRPVALPLAPEQETTVVLVVRAPRTSDPAQHNFVIEAASASDASSRTQLQLVALTNARTALRIRALNDTFDVAPGLNATLPVEVVNEGVETAIDMTYRAADLPGWNITLDPPTFELRSPGVVDPRDGTPLDRRIVNLTVRAGPDAAVGFIMPVEITASSATRLGDAEAPSAKTLATAVVVNNFTLLVPELLERSVLPGDSIEYELVLRSVANGNFTVEPVATRLPPGWRLAEGARERVAMSPGEERTVKVAVATRPNEAAGTYQGDFGFVMEDELGRRGVATAPFNVRVKRHVDYDAIPEGEFLLPPNGTTRARFTLVNTGNVDTTIALSLLAPAGWSASFVDGAQALLPLVAGERKAVDVRIDAPTDTTAEDAEFELRGSIPLERDETTAFRVVVLRDDLAISEVRTLTERFRVGQPAVFQVTLVNNGTVPRTNVEVALLVDGETSRNVTVRSLPPGEARTVQIPWNVVPATTVDFVVDPADAYRETDEANNRRTFDLAAAERSPLPAPSTLVVVALALALALVRRRRS